MNVAEVEMRRQRILITGADGQLGLALQQKAGDTCELYPLTIKECDITRSKQINEYVDSIKPDVVIHCAAYTAVDMAEMEVEVCHQINVEGTENVANACIRDGCALMLLSTDYVFDGEGDAPYETDCMRAPLNQYGMSKMGAEDIAKKVPMHCIVRTSWIFGNGKNFVKTICRAGRAHGRVNVVCDQVGSPTYSEDLASVIMLLAAKNCSGIYHVTNEGFCSWAELAQESFKLMGIDATVSFVTSEEYPSLAKRPHNSRLSKASMDSAGLSRLPHWKDALARYIEKYRDGI